jgi:hypothetical protein
MKQTEDRIVYFGYLVHDLLLKLDGNKISDFVKSVHKQVTEKKFITENQINAVYKIAKRNNINPDDYYRDVVFKTREASET